MHGCWVQTPMATDTAVSQKPSGALPRVNRVTVLWAECEVLDPHSGPGGFPMTSHLSQSDCRWSQVALRLPPEAQQITARPNQLRPPHVELRPLLRAAPPARLKSHTGHHRASQGIARSLKKETSQFLAKLCCYLFWPGWLRSLQVWQQLGPGGGQGPQKEPQRAPKLLFGALCVCSLYFICLVFFLFFCVKMYWECYGVAVLQGVAVRSSSSTATQRFPTHSELKPNLPIARTVPAFQNVGLYGFKSLMLLSSDCPGRLATT